MIESRYSNRARGKTAILGFDDFARSNLQIKHLETKLYKPWCKPQIQ